jgi:putative peptidoglycan lipid II flippase
VNERCADAVYGVGRTPLNEFEKVMSHGAQQAPVSSCAIVAPSGWWKRRTTWLRGSVNGRIFAATAMIAAIGVLVKITSLGKEVLVARYFGASDMLDCFYVAFVLPTFLIGILANSCNDAVIPTYIEVREREGLRAADRVFSSVAFLYFLMLIGVSFSLAILQKWLLPVLGSSFGPGKLALTRNLFFILLGTLSLSGMSALWRAVLNAHECFALTALAPICIPSAIGLGLVLHGQDWRIYAITLGVICGVAAELICNGYGLWRLGLSLIPRWYGFEMAVLQVLTQAVPAAAAAALMGSTLLVDQAMAAMLGSGDVSAFNYASKLIPVILGVGTTAFSVAVFPALSRLGANRDWTAVREVMSFYTRLILLVTVPLTLILVVSSQWIVGLVFQRGAFTAETAHLVARVQALLSLEVPFYALCILCSSAVCAFKRNGVLLWGTAICVVANITLNYAFMKMFGLPGIALSTSAVYALSFVYLRLMVDRAIREEESIMDRPADAVMAVLEPG